ncbi:DNA cytosine methyltransferase [Candidatus Micrarchaeota archaeon]|nr:DNA cytosine methyltransferase [Candidatus Micrarchaeota archaeon]
MRNKKYRIVSLFSGCGGMDLGFEDEGFEVVWANDIFKAACDTFDQNFKTKIDRRDIADVDVKDIPDCDVVVGGFPCQDFSMIWKRGGIETDRGNLYKHFVRIVKAKSPKVFVAENVKGLMSANEGKAIETIISDFTNNGEGYNITAKVYNFAEYGVPQLRQRVLIIGIRKDLGIFFTPPKKSHDESTYVTAGEALDGAEKAEYNNEKLKIADRTKEILKRIPEGGNFTSIPKDSPYYVKGMISHVYRRLNRNKPSTTLIAGGGGGTWGYHFEEPRPLTNRERARIQSFPDDFVFIGSIAEVRKQIGNAVPPKGIKPFAKEIKKILDGKIKGQTTLLI